MRIVGGKFAGLDLVSPNDFRVRPTAELVRAAMLDRLRDLLPKARILDLFAGTGALGLEALSRGAEHATFVETDPRATAAIKGNAAKLGVTDQVRILGGSALALPRSETFDLIFADPPYAPGSGSAVAKAIGDAGWLAPGGWLSVETGRRDAVDPIDYDVEAEREFGRARITLLRRPSTSSIHPPSSTRP